MKKVTAEWVKKAEADHRSMTVLRGQDPPVHDVVCFHAQQCAEKYLKGLMEELGLTILKTHDLDLLLPLLLPRHPSLKSLKRGTTFLSNFAVALGTLARTPRNGRRKPPRDGPAGREASHAGLA